jgi:hypothetical protein
MELTIDGSAHRVEAEADTPFPWNFLRSPVAEESGGIWKSSTMERNDGDV